MERRSWWRRPTVLVPSAFVALMAISLALFAFQPWRLFIDVTVDEDLPVATAAISEVTPTGTPSSEETGSSDQDTISPQSQATAATRVVNAEGTFISHEHSTEGKVQLITLEDGSRILRITDLDTDNGPDLKVWLAAAPVIEGRDGWFVFDDEDYLDLGALKGNKGNQNYRIPADADISDLTSVTIWCDRFSVSFGAAELIPA